MTTGIKYQAQINRSNRNNSHTLALEFAANGSLSPLKILEVGCSAGYFGVALKQLGHHVCGVEMDSDSSALAREVLDEVHCCTVQAFFQRFEDRQFDVITFGDVLEHLAYPKDVLLEARKHLTPNGRIVCSVPNVGHASVRGMLMQGDWDYSELGILDKTHLRFFTKKTLLSLFDETGFCVQKLQAVRLSTESAAEMCGIELQKNTLKLLDSVPIDDSLLDFQYVLCATPRSTRPGTLEERQLPGQTRVMHILATCDQPNSNITRIRMGVPLQAFADQAGRMLRLKSFANTTPQDVAWADVVVIQRGATRHAQKVAQWCMRSATPYVYEIDDLLTDLPEFMAHHQDYVKNRSQIEQLIRQASAVTVTNQRLQVALGDLSQSIWVCPNYHAELDAATLPSRNAPEEPVHLFVASSDRIRLDFLSPALIAIKKRYGSRVSIVAIGPVGPMLQAQGVDCIHRAMIPYEAFVPTLVVSPNAIGLIPLDESRFSSCKSSIKFLDYAIGGIATICSDVPPYKDDVEHGVTGLLTPNSFEGWLACISRLVDDSDLREQLSRSARERVSTRYSLQNNTEAWERVFSALINEDNLVSKSDQMGSPWLILYRFKDFLRQKNSQRKARRRAIRNAKI
jgi:2-polyprenyl-3-methyl-5-hydroxy-6-metoxy-1,4-benzoquinol methylase